MKKQTKKLLILFPIMLFITVYAAIPEKITVMQGQKLNFRWGMTVQAGTDIAGDYDCNVKLFNCIPIKTVNVSVTPQFYVVPSGEAIGVKIHTDGVLVVGIGDVHYENGKTCQPAKKAGINTGDRIVAVNGEKISGTSAFCREINECGGNAQLSIIRGEDKLNVNVQAVYSEESRCYKVGLWVRDSTAGIGTLTFYNPENSCFGALGHAICDSDTKDILTIGRGSVSICNIRDVIRGENGKPGELIGNFSGCELGEITDNCELGIYGKAEYVPNKEKVAVASRFQVKEGKAQVLCDVDGGGVKPYEIEITKISKSPRISNKSFVIKVTDSALINKTGGIVQGMSGAPILQNNMLVGAVTHVFVSDPKRGYGIFAENMLDMTMRIK